METIDIFIYLKCNIYYSDGSRSVFMGFSFLCRCRIFAFTEIFIENQQCLLCEILLKKIQNLIKMQCEEEIHFIHPPGQNKRNTLFSRLLFLSFIIWSHICTIDTSLISQLILKVSALSNEKWPRKMQMYSMHSYTIVPKKANFGKIVLLSTNFFKTKYVFGISFKFCVK